MQSLGSLVSTCNQIQSQLDSLSEATETLMKSRQLHGTYALELLEKEYEVLETKLLEMLDRPCELLEVPEKPNCIGKKSRLKIHKQKKCEECFYKDTCDDYAISDEE